MAPADTPFERVRAFAQALPEPRRLRAVVRLARWQRRALMRRTRGITVGLDVIDDHGNMTSMCLPVWEREPPCHRPAKLERAPFV